MNLPFQFYQEHPLLLVASFLIGIASGYYARRRGQNPLLWFAIGFFFGLLGVLVCFFLSGRKKKEAPEPKPAPQPYIEGPTDRYWYFLDAERQQKGPMSLDALSRAWKEGEVAPTTYVWHEALDNWKPLNELIKVK